MKRDALVVATRSAPFCSSKAQSFLMSINITRAVGHALERACERARILIYKFHRGDVARERGSQISRRHVLVDHPIHELVKRPGHGFAMN